MEGCPGGILNQGWKFCIFWEPGSEPKKSLGAKNPRYEKREGEKR